jgi:hypothetical protein
MADVNKLRQLVEIYGVAVRAGLVTPCLEDENEFRALFGFKSAPDSVVKDWKDSEGVRRPITLQRPSTTEELPEGAKDELGNVIDEDGEPKAKDTGVEL